jgi:hypothetical protein
MTLLQTALKRMACSVKTSPPAIKLRAEVNSRTMNTLVQKEYATLNRNKWPVCFEASSQLQHQNTWYIKGCGALPWSSLFLPAKRAASGSSTEHDHDVANAQNPLF